MISEILTPVTCGAIPRNEWPDGKKDQPTHRQIKHCRDPMILPAFAENLDHHTDQREKPNRAKQPPARFPLEGDERDRCVGTGNEQVNARMVQRLETSLPAK